MALSLWGEGDACSGIPGVLNAANAHSWCGQAGGLQGEEVVEKTEPTVIAVSLAQYKI